MRPRISLLVILLLSTTGHGQLLTFVGEHTLRFASLAEAQSWLATSDTFTRTLTPFDLQCRLQTDNEMRERDYLEFARRQAREWTDLEKQKLASIIKSAASKVDQFHVPLPPVTLLIKSTAREEAGAAYCRGQAIVLAESDIDRKSPAELEKLFLHELFHIASRTDIHWREALYDIIGFRRAEAILIPATMQPRLVTNPDAPAEAYLVDITHDDQVATAMPLLISVDERYDVRKKRRSFFQQFKFRLLLLELAEGSWQAQLDEADMPLLIDPAANASFRQQIGRNTLYIIHPEEIMADNFMLLLTAANVKSPEILQQMQTVLAKRSDFAETAAEKTPADNN